MTAATKKRKESTISRLKTMAKNEGTHHLRDFSRIFKYGISGFTRNIWLSAAATLVMTITLVILTFTVISAVVLSSTADNMREKIDITIFFKPETTTESLNQMATIMRTDRNVKSIEVANATEEYEKFIAETEAAGETDLLATILNDNAMRDLIISSMQATMRIKVNDASNLDSIKNTVENDPLFVQNTDETEPPTYNTNDDAINTITSWSNIAKWGGLILSGIFLIITFLVVFNTIRMAIFSRREEIYMEKLVGADNHFIRGPFRVEAALSGLFAGIIASILICIIYNTIAPKLAAYEIDTSIMDSYFHNPPYLIIFIVILLAFGAVIGLISSRFAVHKYLK